MKIQVVLAYNIIAGEAGDDFTNEVNAAIEMQWQPLGGAVVSTGAHSDEGGKDWLYQTMVRYGFATVVGTEDEADPKQKRRIATMGGRR